LEMIYKMANQSNNKGSSKNWNIQSIVKNHANPNAVANFY
jgi:hypothetical protein